VLKRLHLAREIVEVGVLTLLIFLVVRFVIQSYHIEGPSMQPGLQTNQYVIVNKLAYIFQPPKRGDVIIFRDPQDTSQDFIKRVIGLPGDTIVTDYNTITVNGVKLNEKYITAPLNRTANRWVVPTGEYFVLGDNRPVSDDSRSFGFVPQSYIIGKAELVFWPLPDLHFINTYSDTYKDIPTPSNNK
jgi:signal peptidase I